MSRLHMTYDGIYEAIKGDREDFICEDEFRSKIDELIDIGFLETSTLDDTVIYSAKHELKWRNIVHIDDGIKKGILVLLIENPTTFFVLQNTQKGKMKIISKEIKEWASDTAHKVVTFIIVDNDKTLADQSVDGILRVFGEQPVKIFMLSTNTKTTFDEIKTYIDAYANDIDQEYPMPVVALLANTKQTEKMVKLLHHINRRVVHGSPLRYGIVFDEADKTYPPLRDKTIVVGGSPVSCYTFIIEQNTGLYRIGFVTATDGDLLDEEYPECANAYLYPVDPDDNDHYRALHLPGANVHRVNFASKDTNNTYAMHILTRNREHFITPVRLTSGSEYYRKVIVNSNARTDDMKQFAEWCNLSGFYAMVFNGQHGTSIKVYTGRSPVQTFRTRGKKFNETLFYIYKCLGLDDKPLVIIGRRKVDRGLGFHYAPRTTDTITIEGQLGSLTTRSRNGLIWTDEILGHIDDKNIAVQKAGRLAGIIGDSPQYHGAIDFWTDEYTEGIIRRHNTIVDASNRMKGCSALQAVKHAQDMTPTVRVNHRVDLNKFLVYDDEDTVRVVCDMLGYRYRRTSANTSGFRETSLNTTSAVVSVIDAIKKVPTAYGTNGGVVTYRTCYPCYKDVSDPESLHFVVIIRPETNVDMVNTVRVRFAPLSVPQEGAW